MMVLGTVVGAGVAPADPEPNAAAIEASAATLPAELKQAISRDLKIDAKTFVASAEAARVAAIKGDKLRKDLGSAFGGSWFDSASNKLQVAVTEDSATSKVTAAGGQAHKRPFSAADLASATDSMSKWAKGLPADKAKLVYSVGTDVRDGKINVLLADSDAGKQLAGELPKAGNIPVAAEYSKAPIAKQIRGGDGISLPSSDGMGACSLGFNAVDKDGKGALLTAGHCAGDGKVTKVHEEKAPFEPGALIGQFEKVVFDDLRAGGQGDDYATVRVTNGATKLTGEVVGDKGDALKLDGIAAPEVGMPICKSGRTTKWTCGKIDKVDALFNTDGGRRQIKAFQHSACGEPGDSGGAVVSGTKAVGLTHGGNHDPNTNRCQSSQNPPGINKSVADPIVTDVLPDFGDNLTVLTATGDTDGDGVLDIDELAANPTQIKDANKDGVAAYRDADEPNLQGPKFTSPANDARITERKPVIGGTAKPNAKIQITYRGATKDIQADANGGWKFESAGELGYGEHLLSAKQTVGETVSKESTLKFSVVPPAPAFTSPKDGTVDTNARPEIAGTALASAKVIVNVDDKKVGESTVDADGKWKLALTADLAGGKHVITAKQAVTVSPTASNGAPATVVESDAATLRYEVKVAGGQPTAAPTTTNNAGGGAGNGNTAPPLAKTGVDNVLPMVIGGVVALAGGTALVIFFRRRKAAAGVSTEA